MLGCRSSGLIVSDALVFSGRVKLVSVHATNFHTSQDALIIIYDNTASSGDKVVQYVLEPKKSIELDMHGVICSKGLYVDFGNGPGGAAGIPMCTIEFA
jgi:hypothetical protein